MVRTGTSPAETHLEAWRNSHSTSVSDVAIIKLAWMINETLSEMLTPLDQPLDKLEDLNRMEMCVAELLVISLTSELLLNSILFSFSSNIDSENMNGEYGACIQTVSMLMFC